MQLTKGKNLAKEIRYLLISKNNKGVQLSIQRTARWYIL